MGQRQSSAVLAAIEKIHATKAVKSFACGSLGRPALPIADIRDHCYLGRYWPVPTRSVLRA